MEHPAIKVGSEIEGSYYNRDDNTIYLRARCNDEDYLIACFIHELNHWAHLSEFSYKDEFQFHSNRLAYFKLISGLFFRLNLTLFQFNELYSANVIEQIAWWGTDFSRPYMSEQEGNMNAVDFEKASLDTYRKTRYF